MVGDEEPQQDQSQQTPRVEEKPEIKQEEYELEEEGRDAKPEELMEDDAQSD